MIQDEMKTYNYDFFTTNCTKTPLSPFSKGGEGGGEQRLLIKPNQLRKNKSGGFTLVEVIVTIVAAAILGVIFINFMGTAMSKSTRAVSNVEAEANAQALMEQIVSDYVVKINELIPPNALDFIVQKDYGTSVTKKYITFSPSGDQVESGTPGTPSDTLKITVVWDSPDVTQAGGTAITTLLTKSRVSEKDPAVAF